MKIETRVIKIHPGKAESEKIGQIAQVLRNEGVIVYPTETFYGLGASCFSKTAIRRIYRLKRRPPSKPLPILVSGADMVREVAVEIPDIFWRLAEELWPGPLTVVLKASPVLPGEMLGPGTSVGLRFPSLPWLIALLKETCFPVTATSANVSGEKELSRPEEVIASFQGKVDLIVKGGKTTGIMPSTVVDLTALPPKVLREGALPLSRLEKFLAP